jgi:hypothetical protein
VLRNAREACATEAREIATYMSIERLAETDGDKQTAKLAASIRAEEQKMLEQLLEELPKLTSWVLDADTHGKVAQAVSETARGGATRPAGRKAKKPVRQARTVVKRKAPRARKAPVTARAQSRTSPATPASELPISDYQTLTVEAVVGQLPRLSQNELAKLDSFERRHENRPLILNRIATLRSDQQRHGNGGAREENVGRGRDEGASRPGSTFDPSRSREGILTGAKN